MENAYFKVGSVLSPLTASTANTSLRDADPALWNILRFYTYVIQTHLGDRWTAEIARIGRSDLGNIPAQSIHYDPLPFGTESHYKFPLLAIYRKSEEYSWKSIAHYQIIADFDVLLILPPCSSPDQIKSLCPLLAHAARTMVDRTVHGSDQSVNSQTEYWQNAGVQSIGVKKADYGTIPGKDENMYFPTVNLTLRVEERHMPTDEPGLNFEELAGLDINIDIRDGYEDGYADYEFTTIYT